MHQGVPERQAQSSRPGLGHNRLAIILFRIREFLESRRRGAQRLDDSRLLWMGGVNRLQMHDGLFNLILVEINLRQLRSHLEVLGIFSEILFQRFSGLRRPLEPVQGERPAQIRPSQRRIELGSPGEGIERTVKILLPQEQFSQS